MLNSVSATTQRQGNHHGRTSSIPAMSDPLGAKDLGGKCKRALRKSQISGYGVYINENIGATTYNPSQSSERCILAQWYKCEGYGTPRYQYKRPKTNATNQYSRERSVGGQSSSNSLHISPPIYITVRHGPINTGIGRKIQFCTPEHHEVGPTDLPYKATGLQWRGVDAVTSRQLEE